MCCLLTLGKVPLAQGPFLAGYEAVRDGPGRSYGLRRLDHAVGNVPRLLEVVDYMAAFTGFHEFAEFTADVRRAAAASLHVHLPGHAYRP